MLMIQITKGNIIKRGMALGIASAVAWPAVGSAAPLAWQLAGEGFNEAQLKVVAADATNPRLLYAGSARAIYRSTDGGVHWREQFHVPANAELTFLAIDPFDNRHVLTATTNGLYGSSDDGRHWQRTFRAAGEGESRCQVVVFHPVRRHQVFVGTAGGLFVSEDGGAHWRERGIGLSDR